MKEVVMKKLFNKKTILFFLTIIVLLFFSGIFILKIFPDIGFAPILKEVPSNFELTREGDFSYTLVNQKENYLPNISQSNIKLIKKGNINIEVQHGKFQETINRLYQIANQLNGNLINSNLYRSDKYSSGSFTFMVPSKDLDNFISKLNELGKITNQSITTEDLSDEYFDISGRLKILESQRELLLSWLQKAKEIKDMLSIRSELQNIETEIEKIKGRMNYIDYHSLYSEITIFLEEKKEDIPFWMKNEILKLLISGLNYALKSILNSLIFLIIFVAFVIPWFLLGYLIYNLYKKTKNKI
jgi:hypothetical protein